MVEINLSLIGRNDQRFTLEDSVTAVFITGSSVNGYSRDDSDIDVVVVSDFEIKPIENRDPKISFHYLETSRLDYYDTTKYYCVLHNVPLLNPEYVKEVSTKTKKEMIMGEAKRIQALHRRRGLTGRAAFAPIDLLFRYLTREWGVLEPWRMKPLRRITSSEESRHILERVYTPIFDELVENSFLVKKNDGRTYSISSTAVLNDDLQKISSSFGQLSYYFRESRGGFEYFKNVFEISRNIRSINSPGSFSS